MVNGLYFLPFFGGANTPSTTHLDFMCSGQVSKHLSLAVEGCQLELVVLIDSMDQQPPHIIKTQLIGGEQICCCC